MFPAEAARAWSDAWKHGWEALDVELVLARYAPDCVLSTEPFREPFRDVDGVRRYVTGVFGEEAEPQVWISPPIVEGEHASVSWWASLLEDGAATTLAGTSVLRFDADGRVIEQWDAWNQLRERRAPPERWGPFRR